MIALMDLREELRFLRSVQRELKAQLKKLPNCSIMKTRNRGEEVYYRVEYSDKRRIRHKLKYGSEEYRNVLKGICAKEKLKLTEDRIRLIKKTEARFIDISPSEVIIKVFEDYPRIDRRDISDAVYALENIKYEPSDWALAPYKMSDYKPEEKIHTTSRGLKVRSKSEVIICEIFYKHGIEFRYEEVMYISGRRIEPDFTIRRKSDGKIFFWEHCGMMDLAAYRKRYYEKRELYEFCDIVPWDNMIFTYDKDGSIDSEYIEAIVKTLLLV